MPVVSSDGRVFDARRVGALERVCEAALARHRARDLVRPRAADVVQVLGEVREMREIAERAHDDHRLRGAQAIEQRFELGSRSRVVVAVERDRAAADPLDQLERSLALLVADGVAEQSPEQADVFLERQVLVGLVVQAAILAATRRGGGCTGFAAEVTRFPGRPPAASRPH